MIQNKFFIAFSFFIIILLASSANPELINLSEEKTPQFMAIVATKNGTFDIFYDLDELNKNSADYGIYTIVTDNEKGTEYFTVGQGVRSKIEKDLYNESFLKSEGYLTEKGTVPVIISLNITNAIKEFSLKQTTITSQEIQSIKEKAFEEVKAEVSFIVQESSPSSENKGRLIEELEIINAVSAEIPLAVLENLAESDVVEKVYLDRKVELLLQDSVPLINATSVWQMLDSNGQNVTGKNITIAIIDTGVDYTHPDLGGCLGTNCKVLGGYDFVNNDNDPMDDHGHGTHVAATAASNGTLKGVAPDAKLYGYKVLSSGGWGYFSWVISGVQRSTDPNNDGNYSDHADILSMSLGGYGDDDDPLAKAIDTAVDRGVVSVVAAGNSGTSSNAIGTPAAARKAITVGATDKNDVIAYFSSRGPSPKNNIKPDLTAPGVSICAAQWDGWLSSRRCYDNQHISISGTSMATPHVSGAAALLLQLNRNWTPPMVKSALMSTAKDLGYDVFTQGTGRINVSKAISPLIITYPQSISFGQVVGSNLTANITIQNLNGTSLTFNVTAGLMKNSTGQAVNISYIINSTGNNITSFTISPSSNTSINLSINLGNLEGTFYGYINISSGNEVYRIPYAFTRLSKLTVRILDQNNGNTSRPFSIGVHTDDLLYKKYASQWWDFYGNSHDFYITSGNYTIHATGDSSNSSLYYILTKNTTVPLASTVEINISLNNARPFNVTAYSISNSSLELTKWFFNLFETPGNWGGWGDSRIFSMGVGYLGFGFPGDRIIYISNTNNESSAINSNISLSYIAYPPRNNTYNEYSWKWKDETLATTNEFYAMQWMLYRVNSTTDTILNYTTNQLAIYNYTYNYPGTDPHQGAAYPSYTYSGVYFWISPASWFDFSTFYPYAIPLNRTVYVKDGSGWGWWHFVDINYLHADTLGSDWDEIIASFNQAEHPTRFVSYWPYGIRPETSHRLNFYHGNAPYLPTYFSNQNTLINISKYLLRGFTNETYMEKWISWARPVISVYGSTGSLLYNSTNNWKTFYSWYPSNQYSVNISIPSAYPLSNRTLITAKFNLSLTDKNPPILTQIDITPRFEYNKNLTVSFGISDDYGISNVSAYYSLNQGNWTQSVLLNTSNSFNLTINVTDSTATELNLKIFTNDTSGNEVNYTILPVAMLAHNVSLNFTANKVNANQGDAILFKGRVIDMTNNRYVSGASIVYYLDSAEYGVDRSEINSSWPYVYDSKRGWHKLEEGEFETIWVVPSNYQSGTAAFSAVFNGTGIYPPNITSIQITINVSSPQYSNILIRPASPDANDNIQINSTWLAGSGSMDKVLLESNHSGTTRNYTTTNTSSTYNYTIFNGSLAAGTVVAFRFIGNNTQNATTATPSQTFTIQSIPTNISIGQTLLSLGVNENNTLWCDYIEINNGDVLSATVNVSISNTNYTMNYNATSGRYEYRYNTTGQSSGIKTWGCVANKTNYTSKTASSSFTILAEAGIPTYSNVNRTPDPIYNDMNVTLNSTWQNNVNLTVVIFSSNYTGTWANYTITQDAPVTTELYNTSYTIFSGNFSSNQVIGWKYLANDASNNWNNFMPVQTFTLQNRIPSVSLTYNDNNRGWGENWTIGCNASDADNDMLNVSLWKKLSTIWISASERNVSSTTPTQQVNFTLQLFNTSFIGPAPIKCIVNDYKDGTNETSETNVTVEKDDVNVTVTSGSSQTVQRYGANSINLTATVYDFDRQQYVNTPNGEIYYTKDSAMPYDATVSCVGNSNGNCSFNLDPDDTFGIGIQYFIGGTTSSDAYYKAVNSSQANFTILGTLNVLADSPSGAFNIIDVIYLNASVFDEFYKSTTADEVKLEYKRSIGTAEWTSCTPVNGIASAKYFCALNASAANLTVGFYDIRYSASKSNYTSSNITHNHRFLVTHAIRYNTTENFVANVKKIINATNINTSVEIRPNRTLNNMEINITFNTSNPTSVNLSVLEIGRYLVINVSNELATNLSYAIIKVNYTESEVNNSGVVEESLRLYRFNGTGWVPYNNQSDQYQGGVNTDENYVWGNLTQFSEFGVGGLKNNGQSCTSNSECDSGNCAADYDGEGKWCAASGYCAHDYNVTLYTNGYVLCSSSSIKQTCSSGSWVSETCTYGCSDGVCGSSSSIGSWGSVSSEVGGTVVTAPVKVSTGKTTHSIENMLQPSAVKTAITINAELKEALEKIIGKLTDKKIDELIQLTSSVAKEISTPSRTINTGTGMTTLSLSFTYNGAKELDNLFIYDIVPKSFANSSDDIIVTVTKATVSIVRKDPAYLIKYPSPKLGQRIEVSYTVNKNVDLKVVNDTQSPIILAEKFIEEKQVCVQIITYAVDPLTNVCRTFATPCDVPPNWSVVEKCPSIEKGKKLPIFPGLVIGFIIALIFLQSLRMYEKARKGIRGGKKKRLNKF